MENRRTPVVKDKFPKVFDDYNEGYTFLSIGGKLPRIKAPLSDGGFEAEVCGDPSTIAPVVGKAKACGRSSTKEAPDVGKAVDCGGSSTVAGKAVDCGGSSTVSRKDDDNIFSKRNGSYRTKEEQRMIMEYHSLVNAVGPYDIEIEPPKCMNYPLHPLSLEKLELTKKYHPEAYEQFFHRPAKFALQEINKEEGRDYEFDGIVKYVGTPNQHAYFTIAAKQKFEWTIDRATFQADVYTPYGYDCFDYELLEWKRKPDPAASR